MLGEFLRFLCFWKKGMEKDSFNSLPLWVLFVLQSGVTPQPEKTRGLIIAFIEGNHELIRMGGFWLKLLGKQRFSNIFFKTL
jgi:hypothetical protein